MVRQAHHEQGCIFFLKRLQEKENTLEHFKVVLSSLGLKNGGCCNVIGATLIQGGSAIHPWLLSRYCHPALDAGSMRTPWIPDRAALVRNDRKALYSYKRTAAISTLKCSRRLLKNVRLLRCAHHSSLRRTKSTPHSS
jgi:hypothetical protein